MKLALICILVAAVIFAVLLGARNFTRSWQRSVEIRSVRIETVQ